VYSIRESKIDLNKRKSAICIKCKSRFNFEKRKKIQKQKGDKRPSRITFAISYFEKRKYVDRRQGTERRKKIEQADLPFRTPVKDFIPIYSENHPLGFSGPGRRKGGERRTGIERRRSLTN
jgi:hypothetical protein